MSLISRIRYAMYFSPVDSAVVNQRRRVMRCRRTDLQDAMSELSERRAQLVSTEQRASTCGGRGLRRGQGVRHATHYMCAAVYILERFNTPGAVIRHASRVAVAAAELCVDGLCRTQRQFLWS